MSNNRKKGSSVLSVIAVMLAIILIAGIIVGLGNYYGGWFDSETSVDSTDTSDSTDYSSAEEEVYSKNILNWDGWTDYTIVSWSAGNLNSSETMGTTYYLPVTGNQYIVFSKYGTAYEMRSIACYDENLNVIAGESSATNEKISAFFLPENATYVRVTTLMTRYGVEGWQLELNDDGLPTNYVAYGPITESATGDIVTASGQVIYSSSPLYQAKVAWVGTSITNGYQWCGIVNSVFDFEATNCGVSGATMCYTSDSSMCTTERLLGTYSTTTDENKGEITYTGKTVPEDVEIVFIEAGTNDWAYNWELGDKAITYNEDGEIELDTSTFYGACHQFFKNVTELFPNAVVIAVGTPYNKLPDRSSFTNKYGLINNQDLMSIEYGDALVEVAGMWGFYGFNMGRQMGINDNNIDEYIPDGLHLTTETAYTNAAKVIINNLLQIENLITV